MLNEFVKVHLANERKKFLCWVSVNVAMIALMVLNFVGVV